MFVNPITVAALIAGGVGPPFITDDPEPVEFKHWEVYVASIYAHSVDGVQGTLPHLEVNYGAAPNLQLHVIAPMYFAAAPGQAVHYGYGDTELGMKYRLVQESKSTPMVGVFPLAELPTGNPELGLGNGIPQYFLPVWIQKSIGNWQTYGGGGYWINPGAGNHNYWRAGWEVQNQVAKSLMIGAEIYHSTTRQTVDFTPQTGFNVGGIYDFDDGHHLMASVGTSFDGSGAVTGYFAYQWTFGPKEKGEANAK